ncbi:MAG: hydrogen gas-evolving membrane-bound hydrogenase subunit E [Halioglobus sp.]|nr:hydrogen gas-evolving membrane-bound hydrogenase subunit E [Halioglobus sp.]
MSGAIGTTYDLLLCGGLLWAAVQSVAMRQALSAVILFMVFGLLMALVWARLGTPDLALAEAIIGAGITGALLLSACRTLPADIAGAAGEQHPEAPCGLPQGIVIAVCAAVGLGVAALMAATLSGPGTSPGTGAETARAAAAAHELGNPVTAVLVDFRGFDTLLEMVVLLAACLAPRVLMAQTALPAVNPEPADDSPMVAALLGMATPVLVLTALYLFWAGAHAPGGAFQAGALLGALGVLYRLTGRLAPSEQTPLWLRALLVVGLAAFVLYAMLTAVLSAAPMTLPRPGLQATVLIIEFTLMLSIAATLTLLFSAAPGFQPRTGSSP